MTVEQKSAILKNRIQLLESKGKSSAGLISSLKRELRNLQNSK
jgi:hypothetical protein